MKKIFFCIVASISLQAKTMLQPKQHELLQAALSNDLARIRTLITDKKIDVNVQDKHGNSALHLTSSPAVVFELMLSGANPNLKTKKEKQTPLLDALIRGNRDKAMILVLGGANPNSRHHKKTPLLLAIEQGDYDLVKELIKVGAKVSHASITYAQKHNQQHIVLFLENYYATKNSRKCF